MTFHYEKHAPTVEQTADELLNSAAFHMGMYQHWLHQHRRITEAPHFEGETMERERAWGFGFAAYWSRTSARKQFPAYTHMNETLRPMLLRWIEDGDC